MQAIEEIIVIQQGRLTLEVLRALDYKILEAKDGIEGIRKIIRYRPDLIIVKLELEHLNGLSMVKILQTLQIQIPVIFTAENGENQDRAFRFKNTIGYLVESDIGEKLEETIKQGVVDFQWQHFDSTYHFRQREWADLMGKSERKRLLIVEDSKMVRQYNLAILDLSGEYELYSAENGLQAILKAILVRPDLILSDIEMPEMDGLTMCQILYILGKPFPVVLLSSKEDERTIQKAKKLEGVLGYLIKNQLQNREAFIQSVCDHLQLAEAQKEASEASYLEGSLETLAQTGDEKGLLKSDILISSSTKQEFQQKHASGLGGMWSKDD